MIWNQTVFAGEKKNFSDNSGQINSVKNDEGTKTGAERPGGINVWACYLWLLLTWLDDIPV